jgi:murein DD-endopeptidase MepM/ murein hydrolase activator NlpD
MRAAYLAKPSFLMFRLGFFAVLVSLGGCSSDARRIEMPWSVPTASNPSSNTVAWNNSANYSADTTGSIAPAGNVKSQDLPPVSAQKSAQADIVVDQGDTLYSIARKYNIPASALMKANGVYDANSIHVGQRLKLPEGTAPVRVASNNAFVPVVNASEHIVGTGDTISSISRQYNVAPGELARANNFKAQDSLKIGQKLKIPQGGAAFAASAKADLPKPAAVKEQKLSLKAQPEKTVAAKPAEEPVKIAKAEPEQKTAEPEATASLPPPEPMNSTEFRWPVRGRVVMNYGPQQGGGKNDGINIAVPAGTPVKAAENGVVAYAGSELKGYGKLILIRHDNDFVTAYAHNSEIDVKRGDKVTRGQVIGKAGQSGDVTQPQVHFEIRKGSTPLDPLTHLSGL